MITLKLPEIYRFSVIIEFSMQEINVFNAD